MSEENILVKNAANQTQINEASKVEKRGRELEIQDLKNILSQAHGRRFVWRLLSHCKVFESIWHPSALIHANAGRQDVGHFVLAEVMAADEEAYIKMARESKGIR